jgi:hypothetical protein
MQPYPQGAPARVTTFIQIFMLDACLFNSNIRAGTIDLIVASKRSLN